MKKIVSILACTLLSASLVSTAMADGQVNGTAAALTELTVTNDLDSSSTGGPELVFNPSPNVSIGCFTEAADYAITATNVQTGIANGMEYGILSIDTGYYQRIKTLDKEVITVEPTATDGLPAGTNDWNYVGTGDGSNS